MTFAQWVAAVLQIAASRGLVVTTTYPRSDWVTFNWYCSKGIGYGSCGAGAELVYLTSPEAYTWLWFCGPGPDLAPVIGDPWDRRGRYVPRVPAMATLDALNALFGVGAPSSRPGLARFQSAGGGAYFGPAAAAAPAAPGGPGEVPEPVTGPGQGQGKPDKDKPGKPDKGKPQ